ncbi:uncharacterized protein PV09_06326 [Verruconis gallopava]|uniref:SEC7 domain-containing protein n=1 Tax=Verruconis gallopava TaxID=253628 RepID=A0A0D2A738_9PEZI|nr:uncharacterized protein PV09_06326 [Verruconis gallopava]KIW02528.1 hypothetical protein PV09_06326 [Verruconis gallopava]
MPGKATLLPEGEQDARKLKRRSTLNLFRSTNLTTTTTTNHHHDDDVARPTTRSSSRTNPTKRAASEDGPRILNRTISYSHESERSHSPSLPPQPAKGARFSLARFRHASDPQLGSRAKQQAADAEIDIPPVPAMPTKVPSSQRLRPSNSTEDHMGAPTVMITAPTVDGSIESTLVPALERKRSRFHPFTRQKQGDGPVVLESQSARPSMEVKRKTENRKSRFGTFSRSKDPVEELRKLAGSRMATPNGEESLSAATSQNGGSTLTLPLGRKSESSRSDLSRTHSSEATPISPEKSSTQSHSTFSWLSRRNKQRNSLFPLPVHIAPPSDESRPPTEPQTPRASTSGPSIDTPDDSPAHASPARQARMGYNHHEVFDMASNSTSAALAATAIHFAGPGGALPRTNSSQSLRSAQSTPALGLPYATKRMRSSTMGSTSGQSEASHPPTPPLLNGSGRTSTSTAGRSSFSNLVHLRYRFRHGSDPHSPRQGSPGYGTVTPGRDSQSNSLSISREAIVLPDREEGEPPLQYLSRVEKLAPKDQIPSILSKKTEDFYHTVMRSFMRKFAFFGDPLDMALRKLLMEIDLPKETQQIDRVLSSFADRYHECNPGVFPDPDKAYYMTFSLLLLHSDAFNKSNKRKMTKQDYVRNSSTEGVSDDALECFYDNILYTPFIRVEDDIDIKTMSSRKSKKTQRVIKQAVEQTKTTKEPLDPYTLIFENKLDILRPPLKGVIAVDDPYSYLGTAPAFAKNLLKGIKCGIIQLESSRSRPDAFKSQSGIDNPEDANIGLIDLPVQKVGVLWRKDPKKRTARSPWQEWGAILTGAGLYFFKNSHFVKNFISQYEDHVKHGDDGQLTFKPTIQNWRADFLMPTENGVALHDSTYKKHKNAFVFFRHNNAEEIFLADNEHEMNDWLMKLNCQAAFKTYGIRPRGLLGGHYEGQRQRGMRRLESSNSTTTAQTVQTPTGEVTIQSGKIDRELADQIREARRETMQAKIKELEEKLADLIRTEREQRRDATHLFVLAPIQERTRTQLMHAASRVSAQLKWSRIEIWRIKCHRDILAMDLEDEKIELQRRQNYIDRISPTRPAKTQSITSQSTTSTAKPRPNGLDRLSSTGTTGNIGDSPAKSVQSRASGLRPDTRMSTRSASQRSSVMTTGEDEVFQTPPETTPTGSPVPPDSPASPPVATPTSAIHRGSIVSAMKSSPSMRPESPSIDGSLDSPSLSEFRTPMLTDAEAERQREEGGILGSPFGMDGHALERPGTATSTEPENDRPMSERSAPMTGSPDSKRHVRRSLQRTLRDSSKREPFKDGPHHSKKGSKNESISSTVPEGAIAEGDSPASAGEGLKRHAGSFTVHGKKASVITFGGDWASMDPGERLKTLARHESQKDTERLSHQNQASSALIPPIAEGSSHRARAIDDGFMIPPRRSSVSLKERRAVSQSIASAESGSELGTARSLRKFSSSSGPPVFEDLERVREDARANRNGVLEESSDGETGDAVDNDITPRPNKVLPVERTET